MATSTAGSAYATAILAVAIAAAKIAPDNRPETDGQRFIAVAPHGDGGFAQSPPPPHR
jgi:hypothetical protein